MDYEFIMEWVCVHSKVGDALFAECVDAEAQRVGAAMERVVRVIRRVPSSRSSRAMFWLAAAGEIPSWRAAEAMEPPSRALTKVSMERRLGTKTYG